jgi:PAS domain S-box-containing protein
MGSLGQPANHIELLFQALLEIAPDAIVMVNEQGQIILSNPQAQTLFGYSKAEMLDRPLEDLMPPRFRSLHQVHRQHYLTDSQPRPMGTGLELYALSKAGHEIPVEINLNSVELEGATFVVAAVRDVSRQKQSEISLQQTVAELLASNAQLEQFAYAASHDLREPLRGLNYYLQLLEKRHQADLDESARFYLERALLNVKRIVIMVDDLAAYAKLHNRPPQTEWIDSAAVLKRVLTRLEGAILANEAEITAGDLPMVAANPIQLGTLFEYLLDNALKFRRKIKLKIHIQAEKQGDFWAFSVTDNGLGIETQYLERIFQAFQRLHTRQEYPGNGLGLAICQRIVENHGGRMWVESEFGHGSTFYFTLPTALPATETP